MNILNKIFLVFLAVLFILNVAAAILQFCSGKIALGFSMIACTAAVGIDFYLNVKD